MQITIIILALVNIALQLADAYTTKLYSQFRNDPPNWVWVITSKVIVIAIVVALFLLHDEYDLIIIYILSLGAMLYTYVVIRNWRIYTLFKEHRERNL